MTLTISHKERCNIQRYYTTHCGGFVSKNKLMGDKNHSKYVNKLIEGICRN